MKGGSHLSSTDLGALNIAKNGNLVIVFLGKSADAVEGFLMKMIITVTKIQTAYVHSSKDHFFQGLIIV